MDRIYYDLISKRYFKSNSEKIGNAINKINRRIFVENGKASLNELYEELGLEPIENGDDIGWLLDFVEFRTDFLTNTDTDQNYISIEFLNLININKEPWF